MIHIQATSLAKLGYAIKELGTTQVRRAVGRSLDRTLVTVRADTSRQIRANKQVKLSASDLKSRFFATKSTRGNIKSMFARIAVSEKAISLARFYPRRVSPPAGFAKKSVLISRLNGSVVHTNSHKAVRVTVFGRTQLAGGGRAFYVEKNGGIIFQRIAGAKRLPIKKLYGPSIANMFVRTPIGNNVQAFAIKRFNEVFDQEMNARINGFVSQPKLR